MAEARDPRAREHEPEDTFPPQGLPLVLVRGLGAVIAVLCMGVLVAWIVGWDGLAVATDDLSAMRPPGALCGLLLSLALLTAARPAVGLLAVGATGLLVAGSALGLSTGWELAVGGRVLAGSGDPYRHPAQMVWWGVVVWSLLGCAVASGLLRRWRLAQSLALLVLWLVLALVVLNQLYHAEPDRLRFVEVLRVLPPALVVCCTALAVLAMAPHGFLVRAMTERTPGAVLRRQLSPLILVVLPLTGLAARVTGIGRWYRYNTGVAVVVGLAIAVLLAGVWRASVVVDRAEAAVRRAQEELREAEARTAREFQRVLLPEALPRVPGLQTTARYVTAGGDEVGGDWYDVLPLPHGGVGLVMGDVEGHSATAAAIMGQVRNVLRAYAAVGQRPAEILAHLNRFVMEHTDCLVTCCYLELDPASRVLTAVTAGHPVPVLFAPLHGGRHLSVPIGLPLGVDAGERYEERTTVLSPRSRLVLFTDGLVDDPALFAGPEELLRTAVELDACSAESLADALAARARSQPVPLDDAAMLVVYLDPPEASASTDVAWHVYGSSSTATPAARRFVRDILHGWGLHDLRDVSELLISELITNAVQHTVGDVRLTIERTASRDVRIGVHDDSDREVRARRTDPEDIGGRGLTIVGALADDWWVEPSPTGGKTVWCQVSARATGRHGRAEVTAPAPRGG